MPTSIERKHTKLAARYARHFPRQTRKAERPISCTMMTDHYMTLGPRRRRVVYAHIKRRMPRCSRGDRDLVRAFKEPRGADRRELRVGLLWLARGR
jgi:hypothetical protein